MSILIWYSIGEDQQSILDAGKKRKLIRNHVEGTEVVEGAASQEDLQEDTTRKMNMKKTFLNWVEGMVHQNLALL